MKKKQAPDNDLQTVLDAIRGEGAWYKSKSGEKKESSSFGNVTAISNRLGVSRRTVYNYIERWKTVADAIDDERERRKDFVEDKMFQRIISGSDTMIIFFAKTQMKDRGYIERQELSGPDGRDLKAPAYILENRPDDTDK